MFVTFAFVTGWRRLAKRYPHRGPGAAPLPPLCSTRGVMLDAWGWNAPPMRLGYDECGIVLQPLPVFRPAFATVYFPWDAVVSVERRTSFHGDVTFVRFGPTEREVLRFLPSALDRRLAELSEGGNIHQSPYCAGRIVPGAEM